MVEKVIVNPGDVRGLGNVVSPKSLSDFWVVDGSLSSSSETIENFTVPTFTLGYLAGSYLLFDGDKWVTPSGDSFTVGVVLKKHSDDSVVTGVTVKCKVNGGEPLTATTDSNGLASFTVLVVDGLCSYDFLFTYEGTSSLAGCFLTARVHTGGDEWTFDSLLTKSIIQVGETSELVTSLTGSDCTGETVGVEGIPVYFFEEWYPNARLSGSTHVIQTGGSASVNAQLIDGADGNIVKEAGHTIYFYDIPDSNGVVFNDPTEHTKTYDGTYDNVWKTGGILKGLGDFTLTFDIKSNGESRFLLGRDSYLVPTNPQYSIFAGFSSALKFEYGIRGTTSDYAQGSTLSSNTYYNVKIQLVGTTLTFYLNGTSVGSKTISWFGDYDDYSFGLFAWGADTSVSVKNVKLIDNEVI